MRVLFVLAFILFSFTTAFSSVRPPSVAGSFYPADKEQLQYQVDNFLNNVKSGQITGEIIALISPHAGYPYSGQVAAYDYKELIGRSYDTVILIGSSHHANFDEIAVADPDYFATPLGRVPVDKEMIAKLVKLSKKIVVNNDVHKNEHSLEMQLPFLQTVLKDLPAGRQGFKIVPILFGNISLANCEELAYALSLVVNDRALIIASTDWSHYYPYDVARKLDQKGQEAILSGDANSFVRCLADGETEVCGPSGIITTMLLAPALGTNHITRLNAANSGDVTDDKSHVVGYAAIVFYRQETALTDSDQKKLLKIARRTLEAKLAGKSLPIFTPPEASLNEKRGAFVTLTEADKLRGCVGYIRPAKPLFLAVQEMAQVAALEDSRFSPVNKTELKDIKIEISVLSRLKRIKDINEIQVGRDGLYIIRGNNSGLLLPQVPVEWGWDKDEFLKQVCVKASLPEEAWQDKDAVLFRFTADVFHE